MGAARSKPMRKVQLLLWRDDLLESKLADITTYAGRQQLRGALWHTSPMPGLSHKAAAGELFAVELSTGLYLSTLMFRPL